MLRSLVTATGIVIAALGAHALGAHALGDRDAGETAATFLGPAPPPPPVVVERDDVPVVARARQGARIARFAYPRLGIDQPLIEGVREQDLAAGVGRYTSTAPIGAEGVTGVAGHRTGWGSPLLALGDARVGDRIVITSRGTRFVYRVSDRIVVDPDENWVLNGDPDSDAPRRLAVTTCTPPHTSKYRLVVWADLVAPSDLPSIEPLPAPPH